MFFYRYTNKNGEDVLDYSDVIERDSKGYYLIDGHDIYDNKYDRYGDIIESVVSLYGVAYRKAEFSYDAEGNRVVIIYNNNSQPHYYYPLYNSGQWYQHEKHVIKTNDADEVQSVKVYEYTNNKWVLACEGICGDASITIPECLGEYRLLLTHKKDDFVNACHWEVTDPNKHNECLGNSGKMYHKCYDLDGNIIGYGGYARFDNEYGGYTSYSSGSDTRTHIYNQFNELILYKLEKFSNGKLTTVTETITDEYYNDFIPVVQTKYRYGQITQRTIKNYDWNVDARTIVGSPTKHYKLLSEEIISDDGSSSVSRYYYSKFGPDSPTGLRYVEKSTNTMSIYGVTGTQRQQLQKGLNIVNEGGKTRKMVVR